MAQSKKTQSERLKQRKAAQRKRERKVKLQRFFLCMLLLFAGCGFVIQALHVSTETTDEDVQEEVLSNTEAYPDSLIELMERNPETAQFVKDYTTEYGKSHTIDLSSEVTQGEIPLFIQWDERWGYETYGGDMIAITGCGPTSLSMVLCGLTGDTSWSPLQVAEFAEENDYYESGSGSKWTLMSEGAEQLGLTAEELPLDESRVMQELSEGNPIICIMGPGDFTTSGHYIVMRGVTDDGAILINDPNSKIRSAKEWNFEDISDQIKNLWVYNV